MTCNFNQIRGFLLLLQNVFVCVILFLIKIMFVALIFHCSKFSLKPIVRGQTEDFRGTAA